MLERQLRLFPYAKPLSQKLGAEFFRSIPKTPGVYTMFDSAGRIIYIGQSRNLKHRLGSYRYVNPDRSSRKLVRLVHSVAEIRWESCTDGAVARLKENSLLRKHRPKFNSVNTWPQAHCFISLSQQANDLVFAFTRDHPADPSNYYGAFKSGCLVGYHSVLRLLWTAVHAPKSVHDYPRQLLDYKAPREFPIRFSDANHISITPTMELLRAFLSGDSTTLVDSLRIHVPQPETLFHRNLIEVDFQNLEAFFHRVLRRNAELKHRRGSFYPLIGQAELDDLLVSQHGR